MPYRKLWIALSLVLLISFAVLGGVGYKVLSNAPPIPAQVASSDGRALFSGDDIRDGQNAWQSIGGQEVGTVWGHGSYVAPDWSADWLHRECVFILARWAKDSGAESYQSLDVEQQAALQARLEQLMRRNTYDAATNRITLDPVRAEAFQHLDEYYSDVFSHGRDQYAIQPNALSDPVKLRQMSAFFWWTAWAASTNRPGTDVTYTQNWPHEPLVGNQPTGGTVVWSVVSFVLLLAGVGGMVWYFGSQRARRGGWIFCPSADPLLGLKPTPSQRATVKYFFVVAALWVVQVGLGAITAHYGVEGSGFYGIPLDRWLPYSVTRTWHLQMGIFWIATSWLAAGLYVAPAISGYEPEGSKNWRSTRCSRAPPGGGGPLAGEWLSIEHKLGNLWFWFGTQGYEYVDLGRFWQILLFGGLVFWLWLMWRALKPALLKHDQSHSLLLMFLLSSIAIPLFYAAGLVYGQRSNLVTSEYWRWWVVHLWVEGFFEVFATVVIAFLLARLKLLSLPTATRAVLFSTVVFLSGGIIGTFHHLYFSGTPERRTGARRGLQRPRGCAPGPDRIRGMAEHPPCPRPPATHLGGGVQVANLFLCRGRVLEFRGRRPVWFPYQPAGGALLHAGPEHHSRARTHGPVWRLRNAWAGAHAVLPARPAAGQSLEERPALVLFLGDQRRPGADGAHQHASHRTRADLGLRRSGNLVRALGGIPSLRTPQPVALAAHDWRFDLRIGSAGTRLVRSGPGRPAIPMTSAVTWPKVSGRSTRSKPPRADEGDSPVRREYGGNQAYATCCLTVSP